MMPDVVLQSKKTKFIAFAVRGICLDKTGIKRYNYDVYLYKIKGAGYWQKRKNSD